MYAKLGDALNFKIIHGSQNWNISQTYFKEGTFYSYYIDVLVTYKTNDPDCVVDNLAKQIME